MRWPRVVRWAPSESSLSTRTAVGSRRGLLRSPPVVGRGPMTGAGLHAGCGRRCGTWPPAMRWQLLAPVATGTGQPASRRGARGAAQQRRLLWRLPWKDAGHASALGDFRGSKLPLLDINLSREDGAVIKYRAVMPLKVTSDARRDSDDFCDWHRLFDEATLRIMIVIRMTSLKRPSSHGPRLRPPKSASDRPGMALPRLQSRLPDRAK